MADFGIQATQLSAPQGAGANPIQGISTPTVTPISSLPTGLLNIGVQVVDDIRRGEIAKAKENEKTQANKVISSYVTEITRINTDGRNSGLSPSEIQARIRATGNQYAVQAASMGIIEDLDKARKAALNIGEVGGTMTADEEARNQRTKDIDKLRSLGVYTSPSATPEYIQSQLDKALGREFYEKEWSQANREIDSERQNLTFSQSQADRARTENTVNFLSKYAANQVNSVADSTSAIATEVMNGTMGLDQGRQLINQSAMESNAVLTQMAAANPELAAPMKTLFERIHKIQLERLESPSKDLDNEFKTLINKSKLIAVQRDPSLVSLVVANDLLGQTITGTLTADNVASTVIPRMMAMDTTKGIAVTNLVGDASQKGAETEMYSQAAQALSLTRSGKALNPTATKAVTDMYINNILDQIGDRQGNTKLKASDLKEAASFMSSPEFAYFVENKGMSPEIAARASKTYQQIYAAEVDTVIRGQLEAPLPEGTRERALTARAVSTGNAPATTRETIMDVTDITFTNGSIRFTPKSEAAQASSFKKTIIEDKIRTLSTTQDALTRLVRIGAHLEGTTDYQSYWENNKATILPYYYSNDSYPIGVVVDGWKLKAYPYRNRSNWERVDGGE